MDSDIFFLPLSALEDGFTLILPLLISAIVSSVIPEASCIALRSLSFVAPESDTFFTVLE
jgi:hypothetical protein